MRIRLVVVAGPDQGMCLEFDGYNRVVVGRGGSLDVDGRRPQDIRMSRHHFLLETAGSACVVRDLGSRTGIRINGAPVEQGILQEGNILRAGHTDFRVEFDRSITDFEVSAGAPTPVLTGPTLEDYDELEQENEGALGVVYRAREILTGRTVALKMLRPEREIEEGAIQHFLREMDVWRHLHHKHIVRIYAVGRDQDQLWIAMEYVEGSDLDEHVELNGKLSLDDACRIGVHVLSALAYGHDQGIVHRDVKPANVLLRTGGDDLTALVADYGLAKSFMDTGGSGLTITGSMKGTLPFMAPEQALNAKGAGPAADIFAVGATLYWALAGCSHLDDGPDTGTHDRWNRLLSGDFVPVRTHRPDLPDLLGEAIDRALERDARRRPASAAEMGDLLRRAWALCRG